MNGIFMKFLKEAVRLFNFPWQEFLETVMSESAVWLKMTFVLKSDRNLESLCVFLFISALSKASVG